VNHFAFDPKKPWNFNHQVIFHVALLFDYPELLQYSIDQEVPFNFADIFGVSPLELAGSLPSDNSSKNIFLGSLIITFTSL